MGILDDPTNPHAVEMLRRSIAMLSTGQAATRTENERSACSADCNASSTSRGPSRPS